jgi:DNA polymerase III subunit epsilon
MSWWEFWKKKQDRQEFIRDFLAVNEQTIPGIRSIDQLNFTVLDTETTGLDPSRDSILSFGAVKISESKIQIPTAVEWYPRSENKGEKTAQIHGLVSITEQISGEEFIRRLLPYLGNSILVGHHLGFDLRMITRQLKAFGVDRLPNAGIDTLSLAIRLEHGPQADQSRINRERYSLDALCKRYGIETDDRHTAAGDAFLTAQLFQKLLKAATGKGIVNYRDLIKSW